MSKIKIVHLLPSFERAGAETIVSSICNFLPDDEYEFHIVLLENSTSGIIRINAARNVQLHIVDGFPFKVKNNIPRFSFKALSSLRATLKEINPDIIHSHLLESYLSLNLWLVSLGSSFKFVHTAHTNSDHYRIKNLPNRSGLFVEKFTIRKLKIRFVCVSQNMYNLMKNHYLADQLEVVKNSIDTDYFRNKLVIPVNLEKLGIYKDSFILLHIGRFAEVKNHPLMFKAIEILKLRRRKVVLLCLGYRGGLWEDYQTKINDSKIDDYVRFIGEVNDPRPYIAASNIGLLPSFHEGLSMAMLEMFSMELPVLISRIPSSEEVVDGVTDNLFIDVNDAVALADKIEDIMLHYPDYIEIGERMRAEVVRSFSVIQLAQRYNEIYKKLKLN